MIYPNDDGPLDIRESRPVAYYAADTRSIFKRFIDRLFPYKWHEPPEDLEGFAPSYIVTEIISILDWKDRLRILAGGKLRVNTQTKTDVVVSRMISKSIVNILPPEYKI